MDSLSGALHKAEHLLAIQTLFSGESGLGGERLLPSHEQKAENSPSASLNSALCYLAQNL